MPEDSTRSLFLAGARDVSPILIGVFPFGVIAGVAAVENGLGTLQALAMSPVVFAGAAQLATVELMGDDAAIAVIVLTALVINARHLMYSAAMAPFLAPAPIGIKAAASYLLTDQAFAVSIVRIERLAESVTDRLAYFFGTGVALWITWHIATVLGVGIGAEVPPEWSLDFTIPLVFIALLFVALNDRGAVVAAITATVVAVLAQPLAYNSGLLVAAGVGIAAGVVAGGGEEA